MDQPTNLEITIKGNSEDVMRAAIAAQRRIDLDTNGFAEGAFELGSVSDFEEKMSDAIGMLGDYKYNEKEDGMAEYTTEQESYGCVFEDDIRDIANEIIKVSPDVEAHISAVITITYEEGYDLCVDVDYEDGELSVSSSEEYYEDFDEEDDWDEEEE